MSIRANVLAEASRLVEGERDNQYGAPYDNYKRVATLWSALVGTEITPQQASLMMCALKLDRAWHNPSHRDSYVDLAGYAAIGRECAIMDHTYAVAKTVTK